jgi:BirA family biotin operon repressor/biotin-[acetyl-CoA-carboxylase] ligase
MSLVLRDWPALLPLAAGVAVAEVAGDRAVVKWPNDVLLDGRKVAGILVEGRPQEGWMVLGIGVNVAVEIDRLPPELAGTAGTLGLDPADVEAVLARLLAALERRLAEPAQDTVAGFARRDALRDREVEWSAGRGRAAGIDEAGRLLVVRSDGERVALDAGEVHLAGGQSSTE